MLAAAAAGAILLAPAGLPAGGRVPPCAKGTKAEFSSPARGAAIVIELAVDPREQHEAQRAFEEGRQPWRGDARWVAASAIGHAFEHTAGFRWRDELVEAMRLECEDAGLAVAALDDAGQSYRVLLERVVRPRRGRSGIWTATAITHR